MSRSEVQRASQAWHEILSAADSAVTTRERVCVCSCASCHSYCGGHTIPIPKVPHRALQRCRLLLIARLGTHAVRGSTATAAYIDPIAWRQTQERLRWREQAQAAGRRR